MPAQRSKAAKRKTESNRRNPTPQRVGSPTPQRLAFANFGRVTPNRNNSRTNRNAGNGNTNTSRANNSNRNNRRARARSAWKRATTKVRAVIALRPRVRRALTNGNVQEVVSMANTRNLVSAAGERRIINTTRRLSLKSPRVIASIVITVLYMLMLYSNPRYPDDVINQFVQYEGSRVPGRILGRNRGKDPHWLRKWLNTFQPLVNRFYQTDAETVYRGILATLPNNTYGRSLAGREGSAGLVAFFVALIISFPYTRAGAEEAIRMIAFTVRQLDFIAPMLAAINFIASRTGARRQLAREMMAIGREIGTIAAASASG